MYRFIALDLDDTLFDTVLRIPEDNVSALRRLDREGVHVVLCSGRPTPNMVRIAREILDTDRCHYVISYNGAIVREVETGREVTRQGVDLEVCREIVRYAREHDLLAQYYHDDEFFVEHADPRAEAYTETTDLPHRIVSPLEKAIDEPSPKLLLQGPAEKLPAHLATLRRIGDGRWYAAISKPVYLEVLNPAVNKGRAMLALAETLGVSPSEIVAVGDSINDIEMLRDAAVGVAVANARDEVKAAADLVTERSAGDGAVAEVAERLFR
ncbi:MAG: Cof-type HAD-IIB family hydrolase [Spirochaetaceae bacterium]